MFLALYKKNTVNPFRKHVPGELSLSFPRAHIVHSEFKAMEKVIQMQTTSTPGPQYHFSVKIFQRLICKEFVFWQRKHHFAFS